MNVMILKKDKRDAETRSIPGMYETSIFSVLVATETKITSYLTYSNVSNNSYTITNNTSWKINCKVKMEKGRSNYGKEQRSEEAYIM